VFTEDGGPISFNKKGIARYGFLRRDAENADDIIWIESPDSHYCYHFVNAS
jgi:9-cis-epoxycarotenoid dioxygenase